MSCEMTVEATRGAVLGREARHRAPFYLSRCAEVFRSGRRRCAAPWFWLCGGNG